jgi:hypothetical protein
VVFAPGLMSPESSRRLQKIHGNHKDHAHRDESDYFEGARNGEGYDSASTAKGGDGDGKRKHRRVRKRNRSDPSSNRPSGHRSSSHHRSRIGDGDDESTEDLPDRFDRDGRRIDRRDGGNGGGGGEMVERLAHDFGDVIDGRKSWRDLLGNFGDLGGGSSGRH